MRKIFAVLAAVAAAVTSTTALASEGQQSFQNDGYTYVYTAKTVRDSQVITGRRYPSGTPFRLVVRGNRVSGMAGGFPVEFKVADARGAIKGPQLAAR